MQPEIIVELFLELSFSSSDLREICLSSDAATQEHGKVLARVIIDRLADIRAAPTPAALVAGNPRPFEVNTKQYYAVDLSKDKFLVFSANQKELPQLESGNIDWAQVYRIKILHIGKKHEF